MKIGFALIPDSKILNKIIDIENAIHKEAGFVNFLGNEKNLPHMTLFQGDMKDSIDYIKIAKEIISFYKSEKRNNRITFENVIYKPTGWYFLLIKNTSLLMDLHYKTLELCKPFIIFDQTKKERIEKLSLEEELAIKRYNYRYSEKAFLPHITIGRNFEENKKLLLKLNEVFKDINNCNPTFAKLTVYKMGLNGTHEETLYEIDL